MSELRAPATEAKTATEVAETPVADSASDTPQGDRQAAAPKRPTRRMLMIAGAAALLVAGGYYWFATKDIVSTDDAFTDGRAVLIAPEVPGYVVKLAVTDNQRVKAGDLIVQINPRDYITARDRAQATLALDQAQLANARTNLDIVRTKAPADLTAAQAQRDSAKATEIRAKADLVRQQQVNIRATTQQQIDAALATERAAYAALEQAEAQLKVAELVQDDIDTAQAQVKQLEAEVAGAKANLDQAELNLSYTRVTAPQDGWVTKRNVELGNYLQPGQALMSLVTPDVWITANFKESQLADMRPGQPVRIRIDAYPGLKITGKVDSIQMGSGGRFTAFPAEDATGNYIKIVQRVPVKITIDQGLPADRPLPLQLSVVPEVTVK
jgi:membrane fusion protein (multidrug efflux system)